MQVRRPTNLLETTQQCLRGACSITDHGGHQTPEGAHPHWSLTLGVGDAGPPFLYIRVLIYAFHHRCQPVGGLLRPGDARPFFRATQAAAQWGSNPGGSNGAGTPTVLPIATRHWHGLAGTATAQCCWPCHHRAGAHQATRMAPTIAPKPQLPSSTRPRDAKYPRGISFQKSPG